MQTFVLFWGWANKSKQDQLMNALRIALPQRHRQMAARHSAWAQKHAFFAPAKRLDAAQVAHLVAPFMPRYGFPIFSHTPAKEKSPSLNSHREVLADSQDTSRVQARAYLERAAKRACILPYKVMPDGGGLARLTAL